MATSCRTSLKLLTADADVDLGQPSDTLPRNPNYPAPPTGHDLMAMFPPAPPDNIPEMRPGPTSGFFQRQERAFFAQAGKEIVRVCVDVDVGSEDPVKSRGSSTTRSWSSAAGPSGSNSLPSAMQSSPPYPHPPIRSRVNVDPPMYPLTSQSPTFVPQNTHLPPHHPASSGNRTPPQDMLSLGPPIQKAEFPPDDFPTEESWRRPIPYAERRRAGKHTRRVLRT